MKTRIASWYLYWLDYCFYQFPIIHRFMKHISDYDYVATAAVAAADNDDYDDGDDYDGDVGDVCLLISRQLALMAPTIYKKITLRIHILSTPQSWWRHQMETFSASLALCEGIHRSPVNSPYKDQSRGALMFSLICASINSWANNGHAVDLRRHRAHYDVIVMEMGLPLRTTESYWW